MKIYYSARFILANSILNGVMLWVSIASVLYFSEGPAYTMSLWSFYLCILLSVLGIMFFLMSLICPFVGLIRGGGAALSVNRSIEIFGCRHIRVPVSVIERVVYSGNPIWLGGGVVFHLKGGKRVTFMSSSIGLRPVALEKILSDALADVEVAD